MSSYLHASWDNNLKTTSIDGKTAQGEPTSAAQAWTACIEALRKRDEHMIQGWKEDIDTLLVFVRSHYLWNSESRHLIIIQAGLFSAVITAFIIEAYKLLQQDPQDAMVLLLAQISQQLANSTNEPFSIPAQNNAFPLHFTRRINILWFSSLVLSLAAASIGILVKQWLRDYVLSFTADFPRRRSRIRQFRRQGLIDWKVPGIVMALPVILQVALAFFLGGVVDLLWQLDTVVAAVITAFVAATLAFLIITTILPTFSDECPYTSPQALGIYRIKQWTNDKLVIPILEMVLEPFMPRRARTPWPLFIDPTQIFHPTRAKIRMWFADLQQRRYHRHWRDREKHCVVSREATLDHHTLSSADDYLRDDRFLHDVLRVCINDTDYQVAWDVITDILHNRAHTALGGIPDWKHVDVVHSELSTLIHLVADVLTRIDPKDSSRTLVMIDMLNRLCRALPAKFDRRQPIHVIHLYQRLYRVLAPLLSLSNMPIQKTVFESMRILSSHSSVSVDAIG